MRVRPVPSPRSMLAICLAATAGVFVGCAGPASPTRQETSATVRDAQPTGTPRVAELLRQALPDVEGKEVRVLTVEYPPGGRSAPHRHPGAIFAYVLDGSVLCQVQGQPLRTYRQGEVWYESPQQVHQVSGNASATMPAKLLVFFVTEKGKPVLVPEQ